MRRKVLPYQPYLKEYARQLRNNSTKSEVQLWLCLKGKQMCGYNFHRQKPLLNFIADFYCYELELIIELDGVTHTYPEVKIKDRVKEEELSKLGLTVLRFKDEEVFENIEFVLSSIEDYIKVYESEK